MTTVQRGGLTLKTGKIGHVNCLRQQIMMPGEVININLDGKVRLEALRERDVMRVNAHLGIFMTPLRWLWSDFPQYLREGPDTAVTPPIITGEDDMAKYGIGAWLSGATTEKFFKFYHDNYLRVYNEWYKWPEDADVTSSSIDRDGEKAVPLQKPWSRTRYQKTPDASGDYQVTTAGDVLDVRLLAETQAKFRGSMKRDVLSFNRWMELQQEMFNQEGSREVDQVPMMVDQVDVGVNPREIPATDGASLGQWQSLYDFGVSHQVRGVIAPEHCILSYFLTVRFAAANEALMPLASNYLNWYELVGDPEWLSVAQPQQVNKRELFQGDSATDFGYLPAGWQWRCDHDVIGRRIDERDSFPMMLVPDTKEQAKDASRVVQAFRSQALGDYLADVYIKEDSRQPIGTSMDSYFSGMLEDTTPRKSNKSDEFPFGGKNL